jgi:hypothetical protein
MLHPLRRRPRRRSPRGDRQAQVVLEQGEQELRGQALQAGESGQVAQQAVQPLAHRGVDAFAARGGVGALEFRQHPHRAAVVAHPARTRGGGGDHQHAPGAVDQSVADVRPRATAAHRGRRHAQRARRVAVGRAQRAEARERAVEDVLLGLQVAAPHAHPVGDHELACRGPGQPAAHPGQSGCANAEGFGMQLGGAVRPGDHARGEAFEQLGIGGHAGMLAGPRGGFFPILHAPAGPVIRTARRRVVARPRGAWPRLRA